MKKRENRMDQMKNGQIKWIERENEQKSNLDNGQKKKCKANYLDSCLVGRFCRWVYAIWFRCRMDVGWEKPKFSLSFG